MSTTDLNPWDPTNYMADALIYLRNNGIDKTNITQGQLIWEITNCPPDSIAVINSLLVWVIKKNFCEVITLLLQLGADVHHHQEFCLQYSVARRRSKITKLLINAGADIHAIVYDDVYNNVYYWTGAAHNIGGIYYYLDEKLPSDIRNILYIAIIANDMKTIKLLLQKGADINKNSLLLAAACWHRNYELVQILLENGLDVNGRNGIALKITINEDCYDIAVLLLKNGANVHAQDDLFITFCRSVDMANLLIEQGINIHAYDDAALRRSVYWNSPELVKFLLMNGANVHANNGEAISNSINYKSIEVAELLLEYGANIMAHAGHIICDIFDVFFFEEKNLERMIQVLIKYGFDIRTNNDLALRRAVICNYNYTPIATLLLDHGADVHINNDECLKFCVKNKRASTALLLLNYGANMYVDEKTRLYCAELLDI